MASGEYLSMKAQVELLERELALERLAHAIDPDGERAELAVLYAGRGIQDDLAEAIAAGLMRDPDVALEVHAREELGLDPDRLGSPLSAAGWSFLSFALGAAVPLAVCFLAAGEQAVLLVITVGVLVSILLGLLLAALTGKPALRFVVRQVLLSALAAAVTFGLGRLFGRVGLA